MRVVGVVGVIGVVDVIKAFAVECFSSFGEVILT